MWRSRSLRFEVEMPDTTGVVAAISTYLAANDCSIVESSQFNDPITNQFFMRTAFGQDGPNMPPFKSLKAGFETIADRFRIRWEIYDLAIKPRLLISVSKFGLSS